MEWGRLATFGIAGLLALAGLALWWTRRRHGGRANGEAGRAQTREVAAAARRRIDVATVARGAIEGTVRDPAGAPVAAAQVWGSAFSKHAFRGHVVDLDAEALEKAAPDTQVRRRARNGRAHLRELEGRGDHLVEIQDEARAQARPELLVEDDGGSPLAGDARAAARRLQA